MSTLVLKGDISGFTKLQAQDQASCKILKLPNTGSFKWESYAIVLDKKNSGTTSGTFTRASWETRDLITKTDIDNIISLSNNQFTLGAGTYLIKWSAPVYNVDGHQTRLRNMSDLTTDIVGSSESDNSRSFGAGVISILENKTFEIQHRSETTVIDNGFGFNLDFGEDNIFTMVEVYKESCKIQFLKPINSKNWVNLTTIV